LREIAHSWQGELEPPPLAGACFSCRSIDVCSRSCGHSSSNSEKAYTRSHGPAPGSQPSDDKAGFTLLGSCPCPRRPRREAGVLLDRRWVESQGLGRGSACRPSRCSSLNVHTT